MKNIYTTVAIVSAFATFLYIKIAFDFFFWAEITVLAALIMGIITGATIFMMSHMYELRVADFVPSSFTQILSRTLWVLILCAVVHLIASRLIIYGFSKDLDGQLDRLFYQNRIEKDAITFIILTIVPITIHYAMTIIKFRELVDPSVAAISNESRIKIPQWAVWIILILMFFALVLR